MLYRLLINKRYETTRRDRNWFFFPRLQRQSRGRLKSAGLYFQAKQTQTKKNKILNPLLNPSLFAKQVIFQKFLELHLRACTLDSLVTVRYSARQKCRGVRFQQAPPFTLKEADDDVHQHGIMVHVLPVSTQGTYFDQNVVGTIIQSVLVGTYILRVGHLFFIKIPIIIFLGTKVFN